MPTPPVLRCLAAAAVSCALAPVATASADTVVAPARDADMTVSGDRLFWSDFRPSGLSRLMTLENGAATALGVRPEPVTFAASAGTDRRGAAVLIYCRGTSNGCRTIHVYDVAGRRERRLRVPIPRGCFPAAPSIQRGSVAFIMAGACRRQGIWLRTASGRMRRLSANDNACCTAIMNGTAAWIGSERKADVVFVKVARPGRRPFTLYRSAPRIRGASTGTIVGYGGRFYWGVTTELTGEDFPRPVASKILRARPVPGATCEATDRTVPSRSRPRRSLDDDTLVSPSFAIGAPGLLYADRTEIRIADAPAPTFGAQHVFGRGCRL